MTPAAQRAASWARAESGGKRHNRPVDDEPLAGWSAYLADSPKAGKLPKLGDVVKSTPGETISINKGDWLRLHAKLDCYETAVVELTAAGGFITLPAAPHPPATTPAQASATPAQAAVTIADAIGKHLRTVRQTPPRSPPGSPKSQPPPMHTTHRNHAHHGGGTPYPTTPRRARHAPHPPAWPPRTTAHADTHGSAATNPRTHATGTPSQRRRDTAHATGPAYHAASPCAHHAPPPQHHSPP